MVGQLLSKVKKDARVRFGADAIAMRPKQAASALQVIAYWSEIDNMFVTMLSLFIKSDFQTTNAMLLAISGQSAQREVIKAAARQALGSNSNYYQLFVQTEKAIKSSKELRHRFAHHLWGVPSDIDDALCLVDPALVSRNHAAMTAKIEEYKKAPSKVRSAFLSVANKFTDPDSIYLFRDMDFTKALKDADMAWQYVLRLSQALDPSREKTAREQLRAELSADLCRAGFPPQAQTGSTP